MKITIETTPAELAEFIFNLVDCDVEIDDDDDDEEVEDGRSETASPRARLIYKLLCAIQDFKEETTT